MAIPAYDIVNLLTQDDKIVSRYSKHPVISNDQRIINYMSSPGVAR